MYKKNNLIASCVLTLCMLTVSFFLSALTILLNNDPADQLIENDLSMASNNSALVIESLPEGCDNGTIGEHEACRDSDRNSTTRPVGSMVMTDGEVEGYVLPISAADLQNKSNMRRQRSTVDNTNRENITTSATVRAIATPTASGTVQRDDTIARKGSHMGTNRNSPHILPAIAQSACVVVVDEWYNKRNQVDLDRNVNSDLDLSKKGDNYVWMNGNDKIQDKIPTGLNCVCIEVYRDNGDMVADPSRDQLIGFSLIMDDPSDHPNPYQFSNLPTGTYFARFYPMAKEPKAADTIDEEAKSDLPTERTLASTLITTQKSNTKE
ncbi:MAG: hypothetical protein ACPGWR_26825 [Ardenticatenaceae bacterium]